MVTGYQGWMTQEREPGGNSSAFSNLALEVICCQFQCILFARGESLRPAILKERELVFIFWWKECQRIYGDVFKPPYISKQLPDQETEHYQWPKLAFLSLPAVPWVTTLLIFKSIDWLLPVFVHYINGILQYVHFRFSFFLSTLWDSFMLFHVHYSYYC